jgi:hypothetical protein
MSNGDGSDETLLRFHSLFEIGIRSAMIVFTVLRSFAELLDGRFNSEPLSIEGKAHDGLQLIRRCDYLNLVLRGRAAIRLNSC